MSKPWEGLLRNSRATKGAAPALRGKLPESRKVAKRLGRPPVFAADLAMRAAVRVNGA